MTDIPHLATVAAIIAAVFAIMAPKIAQLTDVVQSTVVALP